MKVDALAASEFLEDPDLSDKMETITDFGTLSSDAHFPYVDGLIPYVMRLYASRTRSVAGMTHTFQVATRSRATFCQCPSHFVGAWDTVSSVGWIWDPEKLPYTGAESRYDEWPSCSFNR